MLYQWRLSFEVFIILIFFKQFSDVSVGISLKNFENNLANKFGEYITGYLS